jgi:uncharacterized protein (DUF1697 family)
MADRICLLRGVNVGGVKVPMADLKAIATAAGFGDPRTLLASGNLVVESDAAPFEIETRLETSIQANFGRRIDVIVRTPDQWAALMAANPFVAEAASDGGGSRLLVMVMKSGMDPGAVDALRALACDGERVEAVSVAGGEALYMWHPNGMGRSKMAEKAVPRLIGLGTGRNWNTVIKLATLAEV